MKSTPVLLLVLLALSPASLKAAERPNLIFFLSDDHRADLLGCAGHPILKTPTIDALAKRGVRFSNMFVTTSICAASRATLLTGLFERTHRYTFGTPPIAPEQIANSYPAALRHSGYRTGFIGKFGVGVPRGAVDQMFSFFRPLGRSPYFKKQPDGSLRHETELAADAAIQFLGQCDADVPFCLSVSFNAAHAEDSDKKNHFPWPRAMDGMYEDVSIPPPLLSAPEVFASQPEFLKKSLNRVRFFWRWDTPEKYDKNVRAYYRMISGLDHAMGRVLAELQRKGWQDNTVVVFAGDNGYYQGARGFAGKWSHYEESLRVPLVIADPRNSARHGSVEDAIVLNVDVAPTLLDLAGAAVKLQGESLRPWLENRPPRSWRVDFFCEHLMEHPQIPKWEGVRGTRYVYANYFQQDPPFEFLHDLQQDPSQLNNLAADPAHAEALDQARRRCLALRDQWGGEFRPHPKKNAKPPSGKKK